MKFFLDDIRNIDTQLGYITFRKYEDFIRELSAFRNILETVSLDYSLGTEKTGYDVLVFMSENEIYPNHINVHSDHEFGVPKMRAYLERKFPSTTNVTYNKI